MQSELEKDFSVCDLEEFEIKLQTASYILIIGDVSRIVSTGCDAPGVILANCSDEFIDIYNKADIIISKGQGNFEGLSEEKGNIFFLLKAKCPMIARKFNVNVNEYVFKYSGKNSSFIKEKNNGKTYKMEKN